MSKAIPPQGDGSEDALRDYIRMVLKGDDAGEADLKPSKPLSKIDAPSEDELASWEANDALNTRNPMWNWAPEKIRNANPSTVPTKKKLKK